MQGNKKGKIFTVHRFRFAFVALFALLAAMSVGPATAEQADLSGFELTAFDGGGTIDLGELSEGLPIYIVFSTPT